MATESDWPIPGWQASGRLREFYTRAFRVTEIADIWKRRAWLEDGTDYPSVLRESLEYLLEFEPFSVREWLRLTGYQFHTEEELYGFLRQVHTYFFVDPEAFPKAPDPNRRPPAEFFGPPLELPEPPELPPLLGGPEPEFSPWFVEFDSDLASVQASEAVLEAALAGHDLAPILSFGQVWAPGRSSEGKATATGVYPVNGPGPGVAPEYEVLALGADALVYGTFHPGAKAGELVNSLFRVQPRTPVDPTAVALAELGLDVPGVDRRFVNFCAGWLNVDGVEELWELRWNFDAAWPDYRETVRAGLLHLVAERPLSTEQWYGLTYQRFPGVAELTHYLAQVHAYLFDTYPAMLRVYGMPSWKIT